MHFFQIVFFSLHPNIVIWLLWSLTKSEVTTLERVHHKILRTIQGLPLRCPSIALRHLMGAPTIQLLIHQRQLNFMFTFSTLPLHSLPRMVFEKRLASSPSSGITPSLHQLISHMISLLFRPFLMVTGVNWLGSAGSRNYFYILTTLPSLTLAIALSLIAILTGEAHLSSHWMVSHGFPFLTKENNFRIRLLVNCHGLEEDACRIRYRQYTNCHKRDPTVWARAGGPISFYQSLPSPFLSQNLNSTFFAILSFETWSVLLVPVRCQQIRGPGSRYRMGRRSTLTALFHQSLRETRKSVLLPAH